MVSVAQAIDKHLSLDQVRSLRHLKISFAVIGWPAFEGKTKPQHCIRNKLRNRLKVILNSCAVSFCTNCYNPGSDIRFNSLPLSKPRLLRKWLDRIRCEGIPINKSTRKCNAHFGGNPKRIGPNNIPSIFTWSKPTTPRPTKGESALSFRSNDDDTTKTIATGPSTNLVSEEDSAVVDLSSESAYHLNFLVDTALKKCSSGLKDIVNMRLITALTQINLALNFWLKLVFMVVHCFHRTARQQNVNKRQQLY